MLLFTALGPGWGAAVPDTKCELDKIIEAKVMVLNNTFPYWIGGSTDAVFFRGYSQYRTDAAGELKISRFLNIGREHRAT